VRKLKDKRPIVQVEELETRVTPDVSLGHSAALVSPLATGGALASEPIIQLTPPSALSGVPSVGDSAQDASYLHALGAIFSNVDELDRILNRQAPSDDSSDASPSSADAVWRFVSNYTKKAIHNDESKYGPVADHEDLVHQVYVEWREQVGNGSGYRNELLNKESAQRQVLRKTVRRVLDRARYDAGKQRQVLPFVDQAAPARKTEEEWRDVQIDLSSTRLPLGPREKQLLELRREGMTLEEIGLEMGLVKQRVSEMYTSALTSLQAIYSNVN
jgi:RNA polymerase sigma factor (sigma-70 family)